MDYLIYMETKAKPKDDPNSINYSEFKHKDRLLNFLNSTCKLQYEDLLTPEGRHVANLYYLKILEDRISK